MSIAPGEGVTIVGDLTQPATLPRDHYDCIVLTQTLQFIYDVKAALSGMNSIAACGVVTSMPLSLAYRAVRSSCVGKSAKENGPPGI